MDLLAAMKQRHSVRRYTDRPIQSELLAVLEAEAARCSGEGHLSIQLVTEEPEAFGSILAHYGMFKGVRNYIALVGKKAPDLHERAGYYGEHLVLTAQALGLNTCWVGGTYSKRKSRVTRKEDESLVCVIALGYGAETGKPHKNRPMESLFRADTPLPDWFRRGLEAAMLAPTAINQQRFRFTLEGGNCVRAESTGGPYSEVDLGIVKYHFELGAGTEHFRWQP